MKRVIFGRTNFPRFETNKATLKMKKLILLMCLGTMFSATAQEAEIKKAQENLKAGKSKEAIRYLREAQKSIFGTIVGQMTEALPAEVGEAIMVGKYKAVMNDAEEWKRLEIVSSSLYSY
jgi:ABC-type tungstate transport system substrate-binding protein